MQTKLLLADSASIELAANLLKKGEVVGIPTETVYGLAADATNSSAVKKIYDAKGRPQDNPLIVHISDLDMLCDIAQNIPPEVYLLAKKFWPGPLTIILERSGNIAKEICAGLCSVAVRMPSHSTALAIIRKSRLALAAPSANQSGKPSPTTAAHVFEDMSGRIPLIIDGGPASVGVESTVLSLVGKPILLRPGFVTKEEIEETIGQKVELADTLEKPLKKGELPLSPGMKYKHYAPNAKLILFDGLFDSYRNYLQNIEDKDGVWALCFDGEGENLPIPFLSYGSEKSGTQQAKLLFAALRKLDDHGAKTVYVRFARIDGIGLAVYNRLLRAAAFRVIKA